MKNYLPLNLIGFKESQFELLRCRAFTALAFILLGIGSARAQAPQFVSVDPLNGSTTHPLDSWIFVIEFDEDVVASSTGAISIKDVARGNTLTSQKANETSYVTVQGNVVIIDFNALGGLRDMSDGVEYYVEIDGNAFDDLDGNSFAGLGNGDWNFTTWAASFAPSVLSFDPANGGTVEKNDPLTIMFDEPIRVADTREEITITEIGGKGERFSVSLGSVTVFGSKVIIPDQDLTHNSTYYITESGRGLEDYAGNAFAGISSNETWRFTAEDQTDPELVSLSPSNGATGVDISPTLVATFNEPMAYAQVNSFFQIREVNSNDFVTSWTVNPPSGIFSEDVSISGNQILFDVPVTLDFNTEYKFLGQWVADVNGNETINVWTTWEFTTRAASSENDIVSFTFPGIVGEAVINTTDHTVVATAEPTVSNRFEPAPTVTLSDGATGSFHSSPPVYQNGVPANYNVSAESGAFQQWQVTINWQPLSGTYSVGPTGDFEKLSNAFGQIVLAGQDGDIVFEVEDGYDVAELLQPSNPDPTYSITVRPESGATNINLNQQSGGAIRLTSPTTNVIFDGADPATGDIVMNVNVDGFNTEGVQIPSGTHDVLFQNLRFNLFDGYGFETIGTTSSLIAGVSIVGCEFVAKNTTSAVTLYGVWFRTTSLDDINVIGNKFFNAPATPDPEIFVAISSNRISIQGSSGEITNVINNSISIRGESTIGITNGDNILHNTIHIYGSDVLTSKSHTGISRAGNVIPAMVSNNIINITRSSGSGTAKRIAFTLLGTWEDNNVQITDDGVSTVEYASNAITQQNFADGTTGTTFISPTFTDESTADLTLSGTSADDFDLRATPLMEVTDDIDGTTRSSNFVTKGAFESPNRFTDVLSFSFPEETGEATIDTQNGTVNIEVGVGTDLTALTPTISLIDGASIDPLSDVEQDFSSPFEYTVTAEDGVTNQVYTVSVTRVLNTETDIISFTIPEQTGPAVIDPNTHTVEIEVNGFAGETSTRSRLTPTIGLSFGATVNPLSGTNNNFFDGTPSTYTVTAEDGATSQEWQVIVTYAPFAGGTYLIGNQGGFGVPPIGVDFSNPIDAFDRIERSGITGDVILELTDSYTGSSMIMDRYEGTTEHSLTLTVADAAGDITLSIFTITLRGVENFIFDGKDKLKVEKAGSGLALDIRGNGSFDATNIEIRNITFEGQGGTCDASNFIIEDCQFIVEDNVNTELTAFNALSENAVIRNNTITFGDVLDKSTLITTGFFVLGGEVYNNIMHFNPTLVNSVRGITHNASAELKIYHNTIHIAGSASGDEALYGFYENSIRDNPISIQNNIVSITRNPGAGGSKTGYRLGTRISVTTKPDYSYNNFYLETNSGANIYVEDGSTLYDDSNFGDLQATIDGLSNSQPSFVDGANADLRLNSNSLNDADLRGTPVSVTTDFFGTTRSTSAPSKGAHEVPNNQAEILSFSLPEQTGPATIDPSGLTVSIEVPFSTDVSSLAPTVGISPGAMVDPASESNQNFTSPVQYDVTAENDDVKNWIITVTKAPARTDSDITSFSITGFPDTPVIDPTGHTVSYNVPFGTNLTTLVPVIEVSGGATINPMSDVQNDFTDPQVYTVTAEDVTVTQDWTITINEANVDPSDIALSPTDIDENQPAGTVVGDITGTDPNGDDLTFSLVTGVGSTHNGFFEIDPATDELKSRFIFDYEAGTTTFFVRIKADDGQGGSREEEFEITLNDVDDTPPALVSRSPEDVAGPINAAIDTNIDITFDENLVSNLNVSNQIRLGLSSGPLVEAFTDDNRISITDKKIIIDPTADLQPGTEYTVFVQAGSLEDALGNGIAAFSWTFTTTKLDQTITFNEFDPATFGDNDITLPEFTDANLTIAYSSDDQTVATVNNNVLTIQGVGSATITASQAGNTQYNAASPVQRVITVDPANVNITMAANTTITYNGSPQAVSATALDLNNDPLSLVIEYSVQGDNNFGTTPPTDAGTYDVRVNLDPSIEDYTASTATGLLTINPREVTVTVNAGQTKVYGQTDPVSFSFTPNPELEAGDNFSGSLERNSGENVGNYAITQGDLTAGNNYSITFNGDNFSITPRAVTVNVDAGQGKVYGQNDPVTFAFTPTPALEIGDDFSGDLSRVAGEDVGSYAINQGDLTAGDNYAITFNAADFAITARDVTVNVDAGQTKVYGQDDPISFTFSATPALESGDDFSGDLERAVGENVGLYAINQGSLTAGANYNMVFNGQDFEITPRPVSVDATIGLTKVFGDSDPSFTFSASPPLEDGDNFTGSLSREMGEDVGTYNITIGTLTAGSNYAISYDGAEFAITPRSVNIDLAANTDVTFDGGAQTVAPTALDLDDAPLGLLIEYSLQGQNSFSATPPVNVGVYDVRVNLDGSNGNYSATQVTGTLTINKATADILLSGLNQTFDGGAKTVTAETNPTGLTVDITYDGSASAPVNAGSYEVIATIDDSNYEGSTTTTLVVEKADQVITFNPESIADRLISETTPINIAATSNSGLTVSLGISGPATLNAGVITIDGDQGTVVVTATQAGNANYNEATKELSFLVISPNVAPTDIQLTGTSIAENNDLNAVVGMLTTSDGNITDSHSYSLVAGEGDQDNGAFAVMNDQLLANSVFDFETKETYTIRIQTDDNRGEVYEESFTITVTDVNDAPVVANTLVDQTPGTGFGTIVLDLSANFSDQDQDALTMTSTSDNENVVTVNVVNNSLTITEVGPGMATIEVTADDGNGAAVSTSFTVTVIKVNGTPMVDEPVIDQVLDQGFVTAELDLMETFSDPDGDDLTLTATSSDESVVTVSITGNVLTATEVGIGTTTIIITADDGNGASVVDQFTITVEELVTGLDDELISLVNVYPNPSVDYIKIDVPEGNWSSTIYNSSGQLMTTTIQLESSNTIDVSRWEGGIYFLRISNENQYTTTKILIER